MSLGWISNCARLSLAQFHKGLFVFCGKIAGYFLKNPREMNKKYPKIDFSINKENDRVVVKAFKFSERMLGMPLAFLSDKKFDDSREELALAYMDDFYTRHEKEIEADLQNTKAEWEKIEGYFFAEVDRIFGGYAWPEGNYTGYLSIRSTFPRWINKKTFTFPFVASWLSNRRNPIRTIAHEMLHFITYPYLKEKHGLLSSESGSEDNTFWQFTENLNVLIENSLGWSEISKGRKSFPYDNCKEQYNKMKEIWDKNQDLDNLVVKIFNHG